MSPFPRRTFIQERDLSFPSVSRDLIFFSHENLRDLLRDHLLELGLLVGRRGEGGRLQWPLLRGRAEEPGQVVEGHADRAELGVLQQTYVRDSITRHLFWSVHV